MSGLDLPVGAGEVVALVGPNGAGKSTALLAIAGDLVPLGGLRRVSPPENEVSVVVPVRHVLARRPGLVLSLLGARVHTTGVLLDLDVRLARWPTPEQAARLHEWVRSLRGGTCLRTVAWLCGSRTRTGSTGASTCASAPLQ